jgi:hypothetical protein
MRRALRQQRMTEQAVIGDLIDDEADRLEKEEELRIDRLYKALCLKVVRFSQPRRTMQTEGIPDRKVYVERKGLTYWHEVKRPVGGKQSEAQKKFQEMAERCGETYVLGGYNAAYDHLVAIGVIRDGGAR